WRRPWRLRRPRLNSLPDPSTRTPDGARGLPPAPPGVSALHVGIVRAASAFRHDPDDVLGRILDVAGLAVHAVLRVDLQPVGAGAFVLDELVDTGRAVALLRPGIAGEVDVHRDG